MRYYVKFDENGEAIGFLEYPYANETMTEVDFEEYNRIRVACGATPVAPFLTEEEKINQQITEKELEIVFTNLCLTDMDLRILDLESRVTHE